MENKSKFIIYLQTIQVGANDSMSVSYDRKSKIGLRHAINLDQLSCMPSSSNPPIILIYLF